MPNEPRDLLLSDVIDIVEENLFDSNVVFRMAQNNRFRDIGAVIVRNALSKGFYRVATRDPVTDDLVSGQSQVWINQNSNSHFISAAGGAWLNITPSPANRSITLDKLALGPPNKILGWDAQGIPVGVDRASGSGGEDGEDAWSALYGIEADGNRLVLKVVDWFGGEGTKPAVNVYLGSTGHVTAIAQAVNIRGPQGIQGIPGVGTRGLAGAPAEIEIEDTVTGIRVRGKSGGASNFGSWFAVEDGEDATGWSPKIVVEADGGRYVLKIVDWFGGQGDKPAVNRYLGETDYVDAAAQAVNIRGPQGIQGLPGAGIVVETGKITAIGSWTRTNTAPPNANGQYRYTNTSLQIRFLDSDLTDRQAVLEAFQEGDIVHVAGIDELVLSAAPVSHSNYVEFTGTWIANAAAFTGTHNETHVLYRIKKHDRLGKNIRKVGDTLRVAADLNIEYVSSAEGQDDSSSGNDQTGVYTQIGSWLVTTDALVSSGKFRVTSSSIEIHEEDADIAPRDTVIAAIAAGDRLQIGDINAFVVDAAPTESSDVYTITGAWAETFDASDFADSVPIYHIKQANVLIHNNVVKGHFLKVGENLLIETQDYAESIEPLWEGTLSSDNIDEIHILNAGKSFSDYSHIIVNYSGSVKRNLHEISVKLWTQLRTIEFSNKDDYLTIEHHNDTSFQLRAVTGAIRLRKLHGYKGV